jgi:hypothetical protein
VDEAWICLGSFRTKTRSRVLVRKETALTETSRTPQHEDGRINTST